MNKSRNIALLFLVGGVLSMILAGMYAGIEKWADFAACLMIANILCVCALQESNYHRIVRRIDRLEKRLAAENNRVGHQ